MNRPHRILALSATLLALVFPLVAAAQDVQNGLYLPANDVAILTTNGATVTVNGNVVFATPDFDVSVDLNASQFPVGVGASVDLRGALALEIAADGTGSFQTSLVAPPVVLPAIPIVTGVEIVPVITLAIGVGGEAEGGMRLAVVQEYSASVGAGIGTLTAADLTEPPVFTSQISPPEIAGGTDVELWIAIIARVKFFIVFQGIPLGGPMVTTSAGLDLAVTPAADPWWSLDFDAELSVGASLFGLSAALPLWSTSQNLADAGGPFPIDLPLTRWSQAYALEPKLKGTSIAAMDDGFALVGNLSGAGWFGRLEADSGIDWEQAQQPLAFGTTLPGEVQATADGGLVSGGRRGATGPARIERLDGDGVLQWTRDYDEILGGQVQLESLIVRGDGGLVFAGSVSRTGVEYPIMVWLDDQGVVEDSVELDLGLDSDSGVFRQLIATADGGWAAAGFVVYSDDPDISLRTLDNRNGLVARFDGSHALTFAKVCGGIGYDELFGIAELADGSLVAAGKVALEAHTSWLLCLEPSGALCWSATYAGDADTGHDLFTSIASLPATGPAPRRRALAPSPAGGAVVSGTSGNDAGKDAWMMRVDARGMPVWLKSLRGPHLDELVELRALPDGVVGCGSTKSLDPDQVTPVEQLWVVRTSIDGMLPFQTVNGFDAVNDHAQWACTVDVVVLDMPGTARFLDAAAHDAVIALAGTAAVITDLHR